MTLRESIQKHSKTVTIATLAALAVCSFCAMRQASSVGASPTTKAYFSDDDGKTWFDDDALRSFPFDHNARPAYRAHIFRCGAVTFCGYLECMPDDMRRGIDALPQNWQARAAAVQSASDQIMVKKPGGMKWAQPGQKEYDGIVDPACPDGSNQKPTPIQP
jgi:hypothetical protein